MAKIKNRYAHDISTRHRHKPKSVSKHAFEKVYWPYLPMIAAICLLLGLVIKSGPVGNLFNHPGEKVLSYATSTSVNGLLNDSNAARQKNHEPKLILNSQLDAAAQAKANDMATRDYWSHNTPDGNAPWVFATASGYNYQAMGENLATGFADDQSVISAWLASPAHRTNLLSPNYTDVGFGFANIADYRAAGGGPMTLVVAFYAKPAAGALSAPLTNDSGQALGDNTSRLQLAMAQSKLAPWSSILLATALAVVVGIWIGRHYKHFKKSLKKSERYIQRHPLMDLGFAFIVLLLLLLNQTAGMVH